MIVWSCLIIMDLLINHPGLNKVMSKNQQFSLPVEDGP